FVQVAADPILLTTNAGGNEQLQAGIFTHQNMQSAVRNTAPLLKLFSSDQIDLSALPVGSLSLVLALSAFDAGAAVTTDPAGATHSVTLTNDGSLEISGADHKVHLWGQNDTLIVLSAEDGHTFAPLPGVETRVADGDTSELQIRGPSMMAGYLANSTANAAVWTADGWYKTGTEVTITSETADNVYYSIIGGS
ncbi:MAG: AMP-binding protein, partial [Rhodospirillaceae bacterium]|nr:AMP-binding protein [Rhodospirillaceae bacterium]